MLSKSWKPMWKMKKQALTTLINQYSKKQGKGKTSNCHNLFKLQWSMPKKKIWEAQYSFMHHAMQYLTPCDSSAQGILGCVQIRMQITLTTAKRQAPFVVYSVKLKIE